MHMKTSWLGLWVLAMGCLWNAGCRPPSEESPFAKAAPALAVVDGRPVPAEKLEHEWERVARTGRTPDFQKVLDELIERERLVARALRLGLDRDPSVQRSWESALIAKLKERELEPALKAAEAQTGEPTERPTQREATEVREQVRLAVLRLEAGPQAGDAKVARLQARLEEARSRASELPAQVLDFGPLAMDYSDDDATRTRGGDWGWMEPDPSRYHGDPAVWGAGFALRTPGDMSPVLRGTHGLYLVRLMDRRKLTMPVGKSTGSAVAAYQRQLETRKAIETAFLEETRRTILVELHPEVIEHVRSKPSLAASEVQVPAQPGR